MSADRIRHNLKQVVDMTTDQWRESMDDDDLSMLVMGGRQPISSRRSRYADERAPDGSTWHGKEGKESDRRSRRPRASDDLGGR